MLLSTNAFPATIATLSTIFIPFVITSIATSCRDKLESTPSHKPLPQYFFLSNYEESSGGIYLMPEWIGAPSLQWQFLGITSSLGMDLVIIENLYTTLSLYNLVTCYFYHVKFCNYDITTIEHLDAKTTV